MSDHLNFNRVLLDVDLEQLLGPDTDRRYLRIHQVDYDLAKGTTRLTLRGVLPDEYKQRVMKLVPMQAARERIRKLFIR